jgi:hypothetical protein
LIKRIKIKKYKKIKPIIFQDFKVKYNKNMNVVNNIRNSLRYLHWILYLSLIIKFKATVKKRINIIKKRITKITNSSKPKQNSSNIIILTIITTRIKRKSY